MDKLYDELDGDRGGSLDLAEVTKALKSLRQNVKNLEKRLKEDIRKGQYWRERANLVRAAAEKVVKRETMSEQLELLKTSPPPELRLAVLLQKKALKPADLLAKMDNDRGGTVDASEFVRGLRALGLDATQEELLEIFKDLDADGSKTLELDEIQNLVTQVHAVKSKAQEDARMLTKDVKRLDFEAKAKQNEIREMLMNDQRQKEEEERKAAIDAEAKAQVKQAAAREAKERAKAKELEEQKKKEEFARRIEEKRKQGT